MPKNLTQKQLFIIAGGVILVLIVGVVFFISLQSKTGGAPTAKLTIWGTDPANVMNSLISSYKGPGSGTNSIIQYVQMNPATYRTQVLAALAAGNGPDIIEINDHDLAQWQSVLYPMPVNTTPAFTLADLQNEFPTVVGQDFVSGGGIYALPLSMDTLAMIYNKDIFDSAGIAQIPSTWESLESDIASLRQVNAQGQITQAAVALGGSEASIPHATDLVFLLMLQNGTQMVSAGDGTTITFASGAGSANPGLTAFNFYLQFSNASSPYYTWTDGTGNDMNSFAAGQTAAIFGYDEDIPAIKAKAPFLNIGVAPMPQPANASIAVNYANYEGFAVSKDSTSTLAAWNFILNVVTSPSEETIYDTGVNAPPALRSMIAGNMGDPTLGVFASQALTARSWNEEDSTGISSAVNTAILNVLNGAADSATALREAQDQINGTPQ